MKKERILKRNCYMRRYFKRMYKKGYRLEYIIKKLEEMTGLHPEYIRTIITDTNKTEQNIKKDGGD